MKNIGRFMEKCALKCSEFASSSLAFCFALGLVIVWACAGPMFRYSDVWQMIINTTTSIITFLMVFLIQRAQNKDILSIHAKLNELIAAKEGASNKLVNIEDSSEEELLELKDSFRSLSSPEDSSTHAKSITEVAHENRR